MGKVDQQKHGAAGSLKPKLKPKDTGAAAVVVVTCRDAALREGEYGEQYSFNMDEYPEHFFYLNRHGVDNMCEVLGADTDGWEGKQIPLVLVTTENPSEGRKQVEVYQVADPERWPALLKQFKAAQRRAQR